MEVKKDSEQETVSGDDVPVSELPTKTSYAAFMPNLTVGVPKVPTKTPTRYKQCYRLEWESMPDFKDWLKPVHGEPTRAFCTYCNKSLHAHRLSLLKHTCTVKHTKAAQSAYAMKASSTIAAAQPIHKKMPDETPESNSTAGEEYLNQDEEGMEEAVEDAEEEEEEVGDAEGVEYDDEGARPAKMSRVDAAAAVIPIRTKLSTHVLDTAKGNPVGGLQVSLYKLIDSRWRIISEGFTNPDGRYSDFIEKDAPLIPGRYKMHFDVDRYFELRKLESLYPFVEIVFDVKSPQDHYHIPLLLSPFGYTTYRGS